MAAGNTPHLWTRCLPSAKANITLPEELWFFIFSYLDAPNLHRLSRTNRLLKRLAGDDSLWRTLCEAKCSITNIPRSIGTWKNLYQGLLRASWGSLSDHCKIIRNATFAPSKHVVKSVMLGDCGVGKTCLLTRITNPKFFASGFCDSSINTPCFTVGVGFNILLMSAYNELIKLIIWDTSGQERFSSLTAGYLKGTNSFLIVFDVTSKTSFRNVERWRRIIVDSVGDESPILLAGLKVDKWGDRVVDQATAVNYALVKGLAYVELSTKSPHNVELPFLFLAVAGAKLIDKALIPFVNSVGFEGA